MNPKDITSKNLGRRSAVPNGTVVRVAGPEDLLAYIPYRLGFEPAESVVVVSLTGPRQRVGLVARVDLADLRLRQPDDPDGPDGAATARWLTDHVVADGADRAVVVLYTATDPTAPSGAARRAVDVLRARLERRLPGTEAWLVAPTGFRALDCADPMCCPAEGRPLSALKSSRVAAHMVLEGRSVAGTREERYALRAAPEQARTQARRAAARWTDTYRRLLNNTRFDSTRFDSARFPDGGGPIDRTTPVRRTEPHHTEPHHTEPHRTERRQGAAFGPRAVEAHALRAERELGEWGAESLDLWRSAMRVAADLRPGQPLTLPPVDLGKLGAALADIPVRDAVLLSLAPGAEEAALRTARRQTDGDTDTATGAVMARIVDPEQGVPPDEAITRAARHVLEAVVTHVPRNRRAPAYLLLALIAWWRGDGGLAAERVSDTLGVDPDYRLALLLRGAIAGGVPPGWVRREQGSRQGPVEGRQRGPLGGEPEAEAEEVAAV